MNTVIENNIEREYEQTATNKHVLYYILAWYYFKLVGTIEEYEMKEDIEQVEKLLERHIK